MDFDAHITDSRIEVIDEDYTCIKCGHEFTVQIRYEYGTGTPLTEDGAVTCSECWREIG